MVRFFSLKNLLSRKRRKDLNWHPYRKEGVSRTTSWRGQECSLVIKWKGTQSRKPKTREGRPQSSESLFPLPVLYYTIVGLETKEQTWGISLLDSYPALSSQLPFFLRTISTFPLFWHTVGENTWKCDLSTNTNLTYPCNVTCPW